MRMNWKHGAIAAAVTTIPAVAQAPIRGERMQFARGANLATVRGSIRGYETVGALAGQTMSVSLNTSSRSAYFNVLPPRSQEGVFNGSTAGVVLAGACGLRGITTCAST